MNKFSPQTPLSKLFMERCAQRVLKREALRANEQFLASQYAINDELHVLDRGFGLNAVTEVEDVAFGGFAFGEGNVDFLGHDARRPEEGDRIEVALQHALSFGDGRSSVHRHGPVATEDVGPGVHQLLDLAVGAFA